MSDGRRVGFVGAGKMATALAKGLCASGFTTASQVVASDVHAEARAQFAATSGGRVVESNAQVVTDSDILVLSVKPQHLRTVMEELHPRIEERHLVVSIAAGVSLATMTSILGPRRLVRVMPNTPCLVGASASAFCLGGSASAEDGALVQELLSSVGLAIPVPETLMDAVTGLSGSGPAYVYLIIEALSDGGVRMGLPRDTATKLAAQTVLGAAKMVLESGVHPGVLKDAVASPGGTTIAGLHALEQGGLRGVLMNAVQAATLRGRELG